MGLRERKLSNGRRPLATATVLSYVLVTVGGVLGIAVATGRGRKLLPGLLLRIVLLVHVVTTPNSRHRLPWMPLLIVYASFAVHELRRLTWRSLRRRHV